MNQRKKRYFHIQILIAIPLALSIEAHAFVLPDSGQTACYNDTGTQISCPGNGQDGDYLGPQPAYQFIDDPNPLIDDPMVLDQNTGLMWMRDSYGDPSHSGVYFHYTPAVSYCNSLELGGYTDWRLPTLAERRTIISYGRALPALNTTYFNFDSRPHSAEWVSDIKVNNTGYAWLVCNEQGKALFYLKTQNQATGCGSITNAEYIRARCVRIHQ